MLRNLFLIAVVILFVGADLDSASNAADNYTPARYSKNNKPPIYPIEARQKRLEGRVVLKVNVSRDGVPEKIFVKESSGSVLLDNAAIKAVFAWNFFPATLDGSPVKGEMLVPIRFRLMDDEPQTTADPEHVGEPLSSMTVIENIRYQIQKNWDIPASLANADNNSVGPVVLSIRLARDGTVLDVSVANRDQIKVQVDPLYQALQVSAVQAVWKTERLRGLPAEKYDLWRDIRLNFDLSRP